MCSANLSASEVQGHSINAQCHPPEAHRQPSFALNSLKLASSSHFFGSLLANENNELGNEMWELK